MSIFLIQTGLIGALLLQRRRRQKSEAALLTREKQMDLAARSASLGFMTWIEDQDLLWLSPQCRALLECGEKVSGGIWWFVDRFYFEDRDRIKAILKQALSQGGDFQAECRVPKLDGSIRWVVTRGRVELGDRKIPNRLLGVVIDITMQRKMESDIQQTRRDLEHLTRVSLMGELASALAHELNQPLAAILSNAQAARRYLASNQFKHEDFNEILSDIIRDDKRAGEVIQRMRTMLRKGDLTFEKLNLDALVSVVVSLLNSELIGRNIRVNLDLMATSPWVLGGHVEIQQVMMNLIMNSIEAMEARPGSDRNLHIATHLKERYIHVSVRDSGVGVPLDRINDIAKPFASTKKDGLGMGLAICSRILEAHGGRLWAENNLDGAGATFWFSLPIDETVFPDTVSHAS
ncbi:MAG: PAS domain-containing protein [Planctomycetes bacterium]|nr:PAS domain-containing protein [Planctomycetota bacterium]